MTTEEGGARLKSDGSFFAYDYFLKDQLGNVRMVLTSEGKSDVYPTLDWEGANSTDAAVLNQDAVWGNSSGGAVGVSCQPYRQGNCAFAALCCHHQRHVCEEAAEEYGSCWRWRPAEGDER